MSPDEVIGQLQLDQLALSASRKGRLLLAARCAAALKVVDLLWTEQAPEANELPAPEGNISVKEAARRLGVSDSIRTLVSLDLGASVRFAVTELS